MFGRRRKTQASSRAIPSPSPSSTTSPTLLPHPLSPSQPLSTSSSCPSPPTLPRPRFRTRATALPHIGLSSSSLSGGRSALVSSSSPDGSFSAGSPYAASVERSRRGQKVPSLASSRASASSSLSSSTSSSQQSSQRSSLVGAAHSPPPSLPPLLRAQTQTLSPKASEPASPLRHARSDVLDREPVRLTVRQRQRRSGSVIVLRDGRKKDDEAKHDDPDTLPPPSTLPTTDRATSPVLPTKPLEETKEADPLPPSPTPSQSPPPPPPEAESKEAPREAEVVVDAVASPSLPSLDVSSGSPRRRLAHLGFTSYPQYSASQSAASTPTHHAWSSTGSTPQSSRSPTSASPAPRRRDRRKLRGVESAMKDAQELAAEGDIDRWVDASPDYQSGDESIAAAASLDVGVADDANATHRRTMEDAHVVRRGLDGTANAFMAVYDGHGGAHASVYASRHLHRLFAKCLRRAEGQSEGEGEVKAAFEAACAELDGVMGRSRRFVACGTTAVCAFVQHTAAGTRVHVANLGDAQAILIAPSSLPSVPPSSALLTTLHTPASPAECDRVTASGGHILLNRVNGLLAITRALGDSAMKKVGITAVPDVVVREVPAGSEAYVVLGCDGVWDVIGYDAMTAEVTSGVGRGETLQAMAARLCSACVERGSTDNVTLVIARVKG